MVDSAPWLPSYHPSQGWVDSAPWLPSYHPSQGWVDSRNDPRHAVRYGGGEELDEEARAALKDVGDYCAAHQACYLVITPCSLRPSVTTARRSRHVT